MKAYGLKQLHHNFEDNHPKNGYVNWWENEYYSCNKKSERQKIKKELMKYK